MRKVFLSFLGMGSFNPVTKKSEYSKTDYELNGKKSNQTEFVQAAEISIIGADYFDKIIIVCTQKSFDAHYANLESQVNNLGAKEIFSLIINEDMSAEGQWEWFERILDHIDRNDELTIDLTHGYRSVPIIFSTAVNFLQKARNITLNAVYYGAYEKDKGLAPIVNMKDFYIINEWAEAVSRLVEDADAGKLAELSEKTSEFQFGELNDAELVKSFQELTNTVRNVDINNVADKANKAIRLIRDKEQKTSGTGKILLKLVIDKFLSLATEEPLSGKYDKPYFRVQLEIIRLLLEHKLFMQAYTVMREFIASIGMIEVEKAKIKSSEGRKKRYRFAEVFISMMQIDEKEWNFSEEKQKVCDMLKPYYEKLKNMGIEPILRGFTRDLSDYRNGFDHAWTARAGAYYDIKEKGDQFFCSLKKVVKLLEEKGLLV